MNSKCPSPDDEPVQSFQPASANLCDRTAAWARPPCEVGRTRSSRRAVTILPTSLTYGTCGSRWRGGPLSDAGSTALCERIRQVDDGRRQWRAAGVVGEAWLVSWRPLAATRGCRANPADQPQFRQRLHVCMIHPPHRPRDVPSGINLFVLALCLNEVTQYTYHLATGSANKSFQYGKQSELSPTRDAP